MERKIADDLRDSLEFVAFGVVIVDGSGKLLAANRAADAILKAADELKSHTGRLACDRPEELLRPGNGDMRGRRTLETSQAPIG